ncbi:hypothetical protein B0T24DRAFT_663276 [Lasiosphaeria ovina]|uniref:Uncharacterized protein n=1 Tax=Lasiosphaeria ovina TaxID=92902 RepID=A0AAE0NDI1_9PEZI|nr:hypothetical protein B0T24DRAFT_663276 [Lasiosphaeria ovina]
MSDTSDSGSADATRDFDSLDKDMLHRGGAAVESETVPETSHEYDGDLAYHGIDAGKGDIISAVEHAHWSSDSERLNRVRGWRKAPRRIGNIELGLQAGKDCNRVGDDVGDGECPTNYPRGILVSKLGKADKTWEPRPCPMCSLMAAVRPDLARDLRVLEAEDAAECELRAFSSNEAWLHFHDSPHRLSNWVDTVFLGLVPAERGRVSAHPRSGFIGRVGSNDNFGGQVDGTKAEAEGGKGDARQF